MFRTLIFAGLLPIVLAGCMWAPYRETAYYDLTPKQLSGEAWMTVADFQNRSGAGSRFQYREESGRVRTDPDNKWIMQPGALVAHGIRRAAAAQNSTVFRGTRVSGELLIFEVDSAKKEFHLYAVGKIAPKNGKAIDWRRDVRVPLKNTSPENVVRAASQAVYDLAEHINRTGGK